MAKNILCLGCSPIKKAFRGRFRKTWKKWELYKVLPLLKHMSNTSLKTTAPVSNMKLNHKYIQEKLCSYLYKSRHEAQLHPMLLHECVLMLRTHLHQISPVNKMTAFENWLTHSRHLQISCCIRPAQIPHNSRQYFKSKSLNFKSICCFLKRIYISVETYNSHVNLIESSKKSKCVLW